MKQGKNPTVAQRRWIESEGLDPADWLVAKWTPEKAVLVNRKTNEIKTLTFLE